MSTEKKYRMNLIGITYNQIESGVYAVILQEADGPRRLPIIIGFPEAQSIECKLQEVVTPRPLTHDMMVNFMATFDISLIRVELKRLPNSVFAADLYFSDGIDTRVVDSRSSDAIALAIRVGAPIYASESLLNEAAFYPADRKKGESSRNNDDNPSDSSAERKKAKEELEDIIGSDVEIAHDNLAQIPGSDSSNLSKEEKERKISLIMSRMQKAAEAENYEEAARLREMLRKLTGE